MKNYNGSCGGSCYMCICQECKGNCAMNCLITVDTDKVALIDDEEECVVECPLFEQFCDDEEGSK